MRTRIILFLLFYPLCSYSSSSCEDGVKRDWVVNANRAHDLKNMHKNYPNGEYDQRVSDFCECYSLSPKDETSRVSCIAKSRVYEIIDI